MPAPTCGAPAEMSGAEIERRRRKRDGLPPPRRLAPRTVGWFFVGTYGAVIAAIAIFVFSPAAGHMSGFSLGTLLGLPLNGVLAYLIGYWIGRWRIKP